MMIDGSDVDRHPFRYAPLRGELERVLALRLHNKRLDGYLLETSLDLLEIARAYGAGPSRYEKINDE